MTHYLVEWSIDIEADSAEEAARQALEIQRNPASMATVFRVYDDFSRLSIRMQLRRRS